MNQCSSLLFNQYLDSFHQPNLSETELIADGNVGLINLPVEVFRYDASAGYAFETASVVEEESKRRLLFIRIDRYDAEERAVSEPDYCIPMAYEGASDRERLMWTIGFGGGWSDCREDALLIFDNNWCEWFRSCVSGVAFSNKEAESAAYLAFDERRVSTVRDFCSE